MLKRKERPKKKPLWARFKGNVRSRLISGTLIVVPLMITIFVLHFLYSFTAGRLTPLIGPYLDNVPGYAIPAASVAALLIFLYLVGLVASVFVGRKLIGLAEAILHRIPLVKSIYGASKQIVDSLSHKEGGANYQAAVLIDFPRPGMKALAFVTGTTQIEGGKTYYRVFVPTTPNPSSGYFQMADPDQVTPSRLSVEDAVKFVMSGGILAPETLEVLPKGSCLQKTPRDPAIKPGTDRKKPPRLRLRDILRIRIVSGLIVVVPLGLTAFILEFLYGLTAGRLTGLAGSQFERYPSGVVALGSIVLIVIVLYAVGLVANRVVGLKLIGLAESIIRRIPFVKTVYGASKQILESISSRDQAADFKTAVIVEFPYKGIKAVGFAMGKIALSDGRIFYKVFIPTSPNVTVGLFQFVAPEDVYRCSLSAEEALKMVISGGIIGPARMTLHPVATEEGVPS